MKDIFGIPLVENALLPKGTAFLIVQDKGVVTQMVKVYDEMEQMSTSDLIAELEKRRHELCPNCANGKSVLCVECVWAGIYRAYRKDDNFKEAK